MKIRALNTIKHEGRYRPPGAEFDAPADVAKLLIEAGNAEKVLVEPRGKAGEAGADGA